MATARKTDTEDLQSTTDQQPDTGDGAAPEQNGTPAVDEAMAEFRNAVREETKAGFLDAIKEAAPPNGSRHGNTERASFLPSWLEELFLGKPSD